MFTENDEKLGIEDLDEMEGCDCGSDCCDDEGCGCGHDHSGNGVITMTDSETGEEYTFIMADDFAYEDEHYCVLLTTDENEPEMVITKVVAMEDGTEGLMSLSEDDYDRVFAEYERLCEEEDYEDEDNEEDI
jgi:hypothetical protein